MPSNPSSSNSSISLLIKSCKTIPHLQQFHAHIIHKGLEQDHFIISHFLSISTSVSYSTSIFNRLLNPSTFLYNILLNIFSKNSQFIDTFSLFYRMKQSEYALPDKYTYPLLIKVCSNELRLKEGEIVHGSAIRCGVSDDVYVGSSLISFYGKCKEILSARKVFDEMPERNVVSWTVMIDGYAKVGDMASARALFDEAPEKDVVAWSALISGYSRNEQPNEAVKIFFEMVSMNVKPDEFIMVNLMSACSQLGNHDMAKWVDSYLSQTSIDTRQAHVLAALIDMHAKCGNMEKAVKLFEDMPSRDLIPCCSLIQGLSIHGRGVEAVELFNRMLDEGLIPDSVAFTVILTACSRGGLIEDGWHFFDTMKNKYSVVPSPDHYACMVDLLSRAGQLKAAYDLLKSMPLKPHACAWGALLGACKLHGDVELKEEVANRLLELEPEKAGSYVLLSNIYASANQWLDVSIVRDEMKEKGVRKIPGRSYIFTEA
ncbi:pentatricopeptide repeat-containing protein [Populus alba x Populus x berolinensis]|uniref:Pentatricopeptide repeat-containing protein n=1 Tax=Populus alba x Populus x berolinensis TaxID=444605 RepID=A0AAD6QQ01_9ROSI|nr:pentatricopeptide repeat-containing protein [Populus alba x Populus x berolinensis]